MTQVTSIGYIGVDVLNDAASCDEVCGLSGAGVGIRVASIGRPARPTPSGAGAPGPWSREVAQLSPIRPWTVALDLARGPTTFGRRFWQTLADALGCPAEGPLQKLRIVGHLIPALRLALHWEGRGIDHLHAHGADAAATVAMHASRLLGVGFSFSGHSLDLFPHRVGLEAKVRWARFIVCISEFHRRYYRDRGADPNRLAVVYSGIDLERFRPRQDGPEAMPRIVAVGRLVATHGFADLVRACHHLGQRGNEFECVIAGAGPEEGGLRELIARLGIEDRVRLSGKDVTPEELPALLRSARVVVLPCVRDRSGDMDGLPRVLIEAMAVGVPVVSTRLAGIPDLVREGRNGLLVKPHHIEALAESLGEMLHEPGRAEALGSRAVRWSRAYFGREESTRRLARLFQWAASHPGPSPPDPDLRFPPAPGSSAEYEPGMREPLTQLVRPRREASRPMARHAERG